jgi:hypothetical protein
VPKEQSPSKIIEAPIVEIKEELVQPVHVPEAQQVSEEVVHAP